MNLNILNSMISQTCGNYYGNPRTFKYVKIGEETERLHCIWFKLRTATVFHVDESGSLKPSIPDVIDSKRKLSKEEILLKQRKRELISGVTDYSTMTTPDKKSYVTFSSGPRVFMLDPKASELKDVTGKSVEGVVKMDVKFSFDGKFYCYTNSDDLHIQSVDDLTKTFRLTNESETKHMSGGVADFIHQEEFDRTTGYWISKKKINGRYAVSYLKVDSRKVPIIKIPKGGFDSGFDEYYYPRPGETNSTNVLVTLFLDDDLKIVERKEHETLFTTGKYDWVEYIVDSGWIGDKIWLQLLDRRQKRYAFVLFDPVSEKTELVWAEKRPEAYINVSNKIHFLSETEFILGSECSGFHHLYLFQKKGRKWERVKPITSGNWSVYFKGKPGLWVDKVNRRVYYLANRDNATRANLYCTSIDEDGKKKTKLLCGRKYFYENVEFNSTCTQFVTMYSNAYNSFQIGLFQLSNPSEKDVTKLKYSLLLKVPFMDPRFTFSVNPPQGTEEEDGEDDDDEEEEDSDDDSGDEGVYDDDSPFGYNLKVPHHFSFKTSRGNRCRGCYFLPEGYNDPKNEGKKYPTILYVYGGPHVQLVKDWFRLTMDTRAQFFASLGFIYVVMDVEGSRNRGLDFERVVYKKMGQIELPSQIEGLLHLMTVQKLSIDAQRIGVYGFSYGGYLSLMAMCKHKDFFKVGISGAPVTDWKLYDTAYTERYMDLPSHNKDGYRKGSVLHYTKSLPDEPNRILLLHGLADENVMFVNSEMFLNAVVEENKQVSFMAYPFQRHMFNSAKARSHRHFLIANFFLNNL